MCVHQLDQIKEESKSQKVEELNELIRKNETELDHKRIRFRELELLERERIEKIDKLSTDINLQETKTDELKKQLALLVEEIEKKKLQS